MSLSNSNGLGVGLGRHVLAGRGQIIMQPRAGVVFQPGSIVAHRNGVQLAEIPLAGSPRTDLVILGTFVADSQFTASSTADANGGALDNAGNPQSITIQPMSGAGTGYFSTGTGANQVTAANIDQPCFLYDDDTVFLTDLGGELSFAGYVAAIDSSGTGRVAVKSDEQMRCLYELYSQGQSIQGGTQDDTVNGVITNLPAGTFANGVFTVTATGVMPTQDTNITAIAVGEKYIVPAGTLTTQVVSAANAGIYECTQAGAVGVQATFARTAKFAQGAIITPRTKVRVGAAASGQGAQWGGTDWSTRPATTGLLVGTNDAQLVPDRVTVPVTLAASTYSITSVPIASAQKVGVSCELTGGTPIAGTVGYGPLVAPTAGGVGAGTVVVDALASGMTKNGTTDVSTLNVTITQ